MLNLHQTPAFFTVAWITKLSPHLSNSHASIMAEARPGCSGASACVNPNHAELQCVYVSVWDILSGPCYCASWLLSPHLSSIHDCMQIRLSVEPKRFPAPKKKKKKFWSFQCLQIKLKFLCELYLKGELLVEYRIEGLPVNLSLKLLLLVRQQVDLYVWVRCAAHVHGRQLCSLNDPHYELDEKRKNRKLKDCGSAVPANDNLHLHLTSFLTERLYHG